MPVEAPHPLRRHAPEPGGIVPADEVIGLYSEDMAEDGRIVRLYDLHDGRTGAQAFLPGEAPGPIRYC